MQILDQHSEILSLSKVFLMVGELPKAELVAKTFLTNYRYFENILGLDFYCGKYKNLNISILIHKPKVADVDLCTHLLFSHEFFNAELVIRIGSCIPLEKNIEKDKFYIASKVFYGSYSDDKNSFLKNIKSECSDEKLQKSLLDKAQHLNINIELSSFYTVDFFAQKSLLFEVSKKMSFDFLDFDSASLYKNAKFYKKNAISLLIAKENDHSFNIDKNIGDFKNIVFLALETSMKYA